MNRIRNLRAGIAALALMAAVGTSPAFAQNEIVAAPNPDADALQTQIRVLAESPRIGPEFTKPLEALGA